MKEAVICLPRIWPQHNSPRTVGDPKMSPTAKSASDFKLLLLWCGVVTGVVPLNIA